MSLVLQSLQVSVSEMSVSSTAHYLNRLAETLISLEVIDQSTTVSVSATISPEGGSIEISPPLGVNSNGG